MDDPTKKSDFLCLTYNPLRVDPEKERSFNELLECEDTSLVKDYDEKWQHTWNKLMQDDTIPDWKKEEFFSLYRQRICAKKHFWDELDLDLRQDFMEGRYVI